MKTYIGIDNGVLGGLAAVDDEGFLVGMLPMPIKAARKGNEIDVVAVDDWIRRFPPCPVVIEEPGGSKSAKAGASMAGSFHALRAMCEIRGWRWHRVTPTQWQRRMLPGCKAGDTKPRALAAARALWPATSWLATERCRTPHDGMIDAALIAEFARISNL